MSDLPQSAESGDKTEKPPKGLSCGCLFSILCLVIFSVVVFLCISWFRMFDAPMAVEAFDAEEDRGWLVMGDAQGESDKPTLQKSGGNPGGYMEAVDDAVGGVWYWAAPGEFRQAVSEAWSAEGGRSRAELSFDLRQSDVSKPFDDEDVIIEGNGLILSYKHGSPPNVDWTSYRVPLSASAGWINDGTGEPATEGEMAKVLGDLERLWIRGEFRTGPDTGGLDNVVIR